ncbi:MAG: alginate export family protein [bacterium]
MNRDCMKKTGILFVLGFLFMQSAELLAQQNYTPLKRGDYEIVEEDTRYLPGAKISGTYEAISADRRTGFLTGSAFGGRFYQDITLGFQSKINTNVSLNAKIGHKSSVVSEQDRPYDTQYSSDAASNPGEDGFTLVFEEAYLEYNHNPNASLKIGKQYVNIGDRRGLIFEGEATAISQGCRIGTWCYSIGGARIGKSGSSGLIWAQLDYPVYESGVLRPDPWGKKPTRQEKSFSVELFRIMYGGNDIPLAEYGGWTGEFSNNHDTSDDTATGSPVYFDNDGVEYIGFNLVWNHYDFDLNFTWSNMNGTRAYFYASPSSNRGSGLGEKKISGNAFLLDLGYKLSSDWKSTLRVFNASGTKADRDGQKIWEKDSKAYFEVQKGSFGDALIYFNGREGIGDGHSVANLSFNALKFAYRGKESIYTVDLDLYQFNRTTPVFINQKGSQAITEKDIGIELDFRINWQLEERLSFQLFAAYFQPGDAYTTDDSSRPEFNPQDFSLLGIGGRYTF